MFRTTQLLAFLVLPALLQASLGGFVASSAMILWAIFTPLAALALQGLRRSACGLWRSYLDLAVRAVLAYAIYRRARSAPEMAHPFPLTRTLTQRATGRYAPGAAGEAPGVAHRVVGE